MCFTFTSVQYKIAEYVQILQCWGRRGHHSQIMWAVYLRFKFWYAEFWKFNFKFISNNHSAAQKWNQISIMREGEQVSTLDR